MLMHKVIKNKKAYKETLKRFEEVFDAKPGTEEAEEAELLAVLLEKYENDTIKIEHPDPIEAIKFHMDRLDLKQEGIAPLFGGKNRVSEILNRKKPLNLKIVYRLNKYLGIPLTSLINDKLNDRLAKGDKSFTMSEKAYK
jgi:HTH-type transcriptional regulator / antitoxin HigA